MRMKSANWKVRLAQKQAVFIRHLSKNILVLEHMYPGAGGSQVLYSSTKTDVLNFNNILNLVVQL